jgi:hypothetical protein
MRIGRVIDVVCFAILALNSSQAMSKPPRQPVSYAGRVKVFLNQSDSPIAFVGRIVKVNSDPLPCTIANTRYTTWSVSKMLYGFEPGKDVEIGFPSCGGVEAQYMSQAEMLVIAYPGWRNTWIGMKESVMPATEANIRAARKILDDYLRGKVRELVRPLRGGRTRPVLIFEGIIADLGSQRGDMPCPSTVPPSFLLKFEVEQILEGSWPDKQVTVYFSGCGPLPHSPYRLGQRVLVFALRMEPEPPVIFRGRFLLPPEQLEQAKAALEAAEAGSGEIRQAPEKPLSEQIRDFVRTAHDERVSIAVFVGTLVSPVPEHRPESPCVIKSMPSFRTEFAVEQVLQGDSMAHATVVFEGCGFPPGSNYYTGDHLLVFAVVVNGGELVGRLLAPADRIAEAKAALDRAEKAVD